MKFWVLSVANTLLAYASLLAISAPCFADEIDFEGRPSDPASLRAEAFVAAQGAVTTGAAVALAKVSAAFASGGGKIAELEREREPLAQRLAGLERRYMDLVGSDAPEATRLRDRLSRESQELRIRIGAIEDQISAENPGYYELTRPAALELDEVQGLLNDDEAILLLLVSDDATYSFAVSDDSIEWSRSVDLRETPLAGKVAALRRSLGAESGRGTVAEPLGAPRTRFDSTGAHELYTELVKPVESIFTGKRVVMSVTTATLSSLPLQLLVTSPATSEQETQYLADRYAMTSLPSVSSLKALRCLLVEPGQQHRGCRGNSVGRARVASNGEFKLVGYGAPTLLGDGGIERGAQNFEDASKGNLADTNYLRGLDYLPGTKRELEALEAFYGPARAIVRTGEQATEKAIKSAVELKGARYVVFSTHGLLAGKAGVQGEPGLVFTPPSEETKSELDDGLLTASEASRLTLSAEFVVLSACNTGASDGRDGADGLSGLARAFLFAGARSLLVSHWEVNDQATRELITRTFSALDESGARDRAEALQKAMRSVRSTPGWTSPRFWAAFTLVGVPE